MAWIGCYLHLQSPLRSLTGLVFRGAGQAVSGQLYLEIPLDPYQLDLEGIISVHCTQDHQKVRTMGEAVGCTGEGTKLVHIFISLRRCLKDAIILCVFTVAPLS